LVSDHPLYRALGRSGPQRQDAYRDLFRTSLDPDFIHSLREATNGGWALGNDRFKRQIAKAMGRRVAPLPRGRPAKAGKDKRQLNLL
jgi:putative transposase